MYINLRRKRSTRFMTVAIQFCSTQPDPTYLAPREGRYKVRLAPLTGETIMTGEVSSIDRNGLDSNGDQWETHAAVARALRRRLRPFDKYIGPYIDTRGGKLFLGSCDCQPCGGSDGVGCLWPDGGVPAYREPITFSYGPAHDVDEAINAARQCLRLYRKQRKAA